MTQSASFGPPAELLERGGERVQAAVLGAREERLLEHDQLGVERVDLRLEDALGQLGGRDARAVCERERRGERHEPRAGQRCEVAPFSGCASFGASFAALGAR